MTAILVSRKFLKNCKKREEIAAIATISSSLSASATAGLNLRAGEVVKTWRRGANRLTAHGVHIRVELIERLLQVGIVAEIRTNLRELSRRRSDVMPMPRNVCGEVRVGLARSSGHHDRCRSNDNAEGTDCNSGLLHRASENEWVVTQGAQSISTRATCAS